MTTVSALIEQTFQYLYANARQNLNVLASTVTSSATTLSFTYAVDEMAQGSFVAIGDELAYVLSVDRSAKTAEVLRGQRGSTAAAHASGAVVDVNPRFPRYRVKAALQDEIASWPSSVYRVTALNLDTTSGKAGYDLVGLVGDFTVLDVQLGPQTTSNWSDWTRVNYSLVRNGDLAAFPSGAGIVLTGYRPTQARDLRVVVSQPFDTSTWEDNTDLEEDCGLPASAVDIPPMGAAYRLIMSKDIRRAFGEGQGEPRRSEEIPPGFSASTATYLRRERDRRLGEEAMRLLSLYPLRV